MGNLSQTITENELRRLFAAVGPVTSVALIVDRLTGQSKGFGFVEMETPKGAQKAIKQLNNSTLNKRVLTVSAARLRQSSLGSGTKSNNRPGDQDNFSRSSSYRDGGCRLY